MTDHVTIFGTTLRDGEQAPGFSMPEPKRCPNAPRREGEIESAAGAPSI